jgi:NADPH:quinone reductase-like Zn-dependent oxidoreductase
MGRLQGRVAVITGGTQGIGLATAKLFAGEGAYVFITGRRQKELEEAVAAIGSNVTGIQGDVANLADLDRLYESVKAKGRIDILFANVGLGGFVPSGSITEEYYDKTFDTNVKGLLFTVQKALPFLSDGASIILTGSAAAAKGTPSFGVYAASKAAIRSFVRTWTAELKDRRIRANVLSPGPVVTPQVALQPPEAIARIVSTVPMGRMAEPEEIARSRSFWARMTPASSLGSNYSPMAAEHKSDARTRDVHDCSRWAILVEHKESCHVRHEAPSQPALRRPPFALASNTTPSTRLDGGIMSRTIKFAKAGGPEVLEFIEMEVPAPGPHEVRIEVKAIGINRAESMWRNDRYVESPIFPAGLGYDCAGVVDAVGKDVTDFAVGDTVSTIPAFSLNNYFTYGEVVLAPDHAVVKHPASLSFVEAASVWMMFITAYGALIFDAQAKAGDFVIIPAASSSVGLAAIQIANYAGATPIALTRTASKKKRLQEAGAAHVVATQEQDMVAEVMRITNGHGARVAFDPVGGPDFPKLIAALSNQGIAYIYGALSEDDTPIPVLEMIRKMPTVKGYSIRLVTGDEARRKVAVEYVTKGLASGALKPIIDRIFKFDDMVEVHRYLENSGQFGKIVVTL